MKKLDDLEEKIKNQVCKECECRKYFERNNNEHDPNLKKSIDELLKTAINNYRRLQQNENT